MLMYTEHIHTGPGILWSSPYKFDQRERTDFLTGMAVGISPANASPSNDTRIYNGYFALRGPCFNGPGIVSWERFVSAKAAIVALFP